MCVRTVIHQETPEHEPDAAQYTENVEHGLPAYVVGQNPADRHGDDSAGLRSWKQQRETIQYLKKRKQPWFCHSHLRK